MFAYHSTSFSSDSGFNVAYEMSYDEEIFTSLSEMSDDVWDVIEKQKNKRREAQRRNKRRYPPQLQKHAMASHAAQTDEKIMDETLSVQQHGAFEQHRAILVEDDAKFPLDHPILRQNNGMNDRSFFATTESTVLEQNSRNGPQSTTRKRRTDANDYKHSSQERIGRGHSKNRITSESLSEFSSLQAEWYTFRGNPVKEADDFTADGNYVYSRKPYQSSANAYLDHDDLASESLEIFETTNALGNPESASVRGKSASRSEGSASATRRGAKDCRRHSNHLLVLKESESGGDAIPPVESATGDTFSTFSAHSIPPDFFCCAAW